MPDEFDPELREEALRVLAEVQAEPEIECAHCGAIPDGTIEIKTDQYDRSHRICNACAAIVLRWL
jgi:hypothetical protein